MGEGGVSAGFRRPESGRGGFYPNPAEPASADSFQWLIEGEGCVGVAQTPPGMNGMG